jgi:hypothetical protein
MLGAGSKPAGPTNYPLGPDDPCLGTAARHLASLYRLARLRISLASPTSPRSRRAIGIFELRNEVACCGQYYAKGHGTCAVWREDGRLMMRQWGKPRCEIFPQSETNFYNQLFDCRAEFARASSSTGADQLILGDPAKPGCTRATGYWKQGGKSFRITFRRANERADSAAFTSGP